MYTLRAWKRTDKVGDPPLVECEYATARECMRRLVWIREVNPGHNYVFIVQRPGDPNRMWSAAEAQSDLIARS